LGEKTRDREQQRTGGIKAILIETQMYWNALFIDLLIDKQQIVALFAR
jgi:hypothetical protein